MIEYKTEIICKNFEQMNIIDNKIYTNEQKEEYYIIPLNKDFIMESDDEIIKLTFVNQLLWLKYSNKDGVINLNDFDFKECVLIKSKDICDIYVVLVTDDYFEKNVWSGRYHVGVNKKYLGEYMIVFPIIENMIKVKEIDGLYRIELIVNEILLKEVHRRNNHGYVMLDVNIMLNKTALFVPVNKENIGIYTLITS